MRLTNPLNLPAPGRSQTLYVGLSPSQSPVFLVNSRYRHFSATLSRLRLYAYTYRGPTFFRSYGGNLPSSLEESSLKRLRIFSSPTCVGLRYGHPVDSLRGFSWKRGINDFTPCGARHRLSGITAAPFHRTRHPYGFGPGQPPPGSPSLLRPPSVQRLQDGAGILTCFPSPTPFGLGLGSG